MGRSAPLLALVLTLCAGRAPAAGGPPRPAVDENVFDFGTVERGTPVAHTFRLPNRGGAELRIDHVKSSCGCTVAVVSEQTIAPGAEGRVAVTLDTGRLRGRTTKTVTVYTNDPAAPTVGLSLTGQVTTDLVITPETVYLGRIRRGEGVRREVTIAPGREGASFTVDRVERSNPAVRARLEPRGDLPGQRLVVELERDIPLGRFNETLLLHTTSPREPVVRLPVLGSVEGDVVVLPPQVTFGVSRGGTAPERELYVRNRGARPVNVTRVAVPERIASCRVDVVEAGEEYRLTVKLRDDLPRGKVEGAVEIFTDHPDEGHIVVPLYAIVRDGRRS
jgi:hypothetical protein